MSIFIEGETPLPTGAVALSVRWSKPPNSVCAVAVQVPDERFEQAFYVAFFRDQNAEHLYTSPPREHQITAMEWQHANTVLVIANSRGCISCIHAQAQNCHTLYTNSGIHHASVTTMVAQGCRLITGDENGVATVWKVDPRGVLSVLQQYRKRDSISCAVFASTPTMRNELSLVGVGSGTVCMFFATTSGRVTYADDLGHDAEVQHLSSAVDALCFYEEKSRLVVITRNVITTVLQLADDGRVSVLAKVKLSVGADTATYGIKSTTWAGVGLLAASTAEAMVRFWDLLHDANYNLSLNQLLPLLLHSRSEAEMRAEKVMAVSFNPSARLLAAGTSGGVVGVWRFVGSYQTGSSGASTEASDWEPVYATVVHNDHELIPVTALHWATTSSSSRDANPILSVHTARGVRTIVEVRMQKAMATHIAVLQTSATELSVIPRERESIVTDAGVMIRGIATSDQAFVVWSGKQARVFQMESDRPVPLPVFDCTSSELAISEDSLMIANESHAINVCAFRGTVKGSIAMAEGHGKPTNIDVSRNFLAVVTDANWLSVYDIRKPTQANIVAGPARLLPASHSSVGIVTAVRINCDGRKVAILADVEQGSLHMRTRNLVLFVYDCDRDKTFVYDFQQSARCPVTVCWDPSDSRLLVVEGQRQQQSAMGGGARAQKGRPSVLTVPNKLHAPKKGSDADEFEVFIMFVAADHGILMHDSFPRTKPYGPLLGIQMPRIYFASQGAQHDSEGNSGVTVVRSRYGDHEHDNESNRAGRSHGRDHGIQILSKVMRDFVGIDLSDEQTKKTLLDFAYYVAIGNLDAAYKSVTNIKNAAVWENMAHMCVKTKRLDVAEVCLGNMGHARGAAAVREAKQEPEPEAQVAAVAIQLGLLDDAARLYRECGRYDLLNELYRNAGFWERAIAVAETRDRIHLRTTHHLYAQHLEGVGDIRGAIEHYKIAQTHLTQVPRMLFSLGRMDELNDFIHRSQDPQLWKWWAGYLESKQRYDKAEEYYVRASDYLSLIRLACFQGNFAKAAEVVESSGDRAAAYYLARQCEGNGRIQEALKYYSLSGCYSHGIRLAKANGMYAELMGFALKASPTQVLDLASFYETHDHLDKAVQLYQRAGQPALALKLCDAQSNGTAPAADDIIQGLLSNLNQDSSMEQLRQCAEACERFGRLEKAVELYVRCNDYEQAIGICGSHRLPITRELAELLSPPRGVFDDATRKSLLVQLAGVLQSVGAFELASAKYTQAGEKVDAMKCLIKSGKTESIIRYASVSKLPKTYEMAANYLQSLHWTEDLALYKTIVAFYTKAQAFEYLSSFYDYCAQMEIDELQSYTNAARTLRKAKAAIEQMADTPQRAKLARSIELKVTICEQFAHIQGLYEQHPQQAIELCRELLADPSVEMVVRLGDCYSLIVNHFYDANDLRQAYTAVQQMQQHGVTLRPYLESNVIADIYRAVGKEPPQEIAEEEDNDSQIGEDEIDEEEEEVGVSEEDRDVMARADEKRDSSSDRHRRMNDRYYNGDYKVHRK